MRGTLELKELITDDDAVSPVIEVILMVAITVILAAVIASFVLGLGNNATNQTPTASFTFDYEQVDGNSDPAAKNWGVVKVSHDGGDSVNYRELYIRGSGFNATSGRCGSGGGGDWARSGAGTPECTDANIDSNSNLGSHSDMFAYIEGKLPVPGGAVLGDTQLGYWSGRLIGAAVFSVFSHRPAVAGGDSREVIVTCARADTVLHADFRVTRPSRT